MDTHQVSEEASPADLGRLTHGTRWTNRELLFHMVLGYGVVRTLLPLVRTLGRIGYSQRFAASLNAGRRPFHAINYLGPCIAARLLSPCAMTALLDAVIGTLQRGLAAETERSLAWSMHVPTGWDPYFTPRMSVLDVYHFGTQHFDHHRRQLALTPQRIPGTVRSPQDERHAAPAAWRRSLSAMSGLPLLPTQNKPRPTTQVFGHDVVALVGVPVSSASRWRTRVSMSSRMGRICSAVLPAGSVSSQSR